MRNNAFISTTRISHLVNDAVSFHGTLAGGWEEKYRKSWFASRQDILRECLSGINPKGTTWLDAGCGTGTFARWLAEQGCEIEAVDAAAEMLRVAREIASKSSPVLPITFRQVESIQALPFPANSFDGILCSSVLEYVPDPHACIEELRRVLRVDGLLLVSVPSARSIVRKLLRVGHACTAIFGQPWPKYLSFSKHQYSVSEFRCLLQAHAFTPEKSLAFGTPLARPFSSSEILGSLLMFTARKQEADSERGLVQQHRSQP